MSKIVSRAGTRVLSRCLVPDCLAAPGQVALPTGKREWQTGSYSQSRTTGRLASLAVRALIEEAELTPKPAIADDRGGGTQEDLSVPFLKRSAQGFERTH
jgi:hypothetical protein